MNAWIRDKVVWTAAAMLALCLGVGWLASPSVEDLNAPVRIPSALRDISALAPRLEIVLDRTADWDAPQHAPAPELQIDVNVAPPHLDSIEVAAQVDESAESLAQMDVPPEAETLPVFDLNLPVSKAQIEPGSLVKTTWAAGESLHGAPISTPVLIAKGRQEGPTLCVTAAVHGDELNGIESVRRLMYSIDTGKLKGMVMGVPIVNLQGFQRHSRYLADRRDLNRFFPGNPRGSSASRMAYGFFNEVIRKCDGLVDLHTGSFHRTNLPQLRADLNNTEVLKLTKGFGATTILHSTGGQGTLRRAAVDAGIPAVTLEAGEPLRLQQDAVEHTVKAVFTLLDALEMYEKRSLWGNPEPTYYSSAWVRADQGGILMSDVKLGKKVKSGDELGTIIDPISNEQVQILAPFTGRVIGMAVNQFVMPGYAAFHIATEAELDEVSEGDDYHTEGLDVAVSDSLGDDRSE